MGVHLFAYQLATGGSVVDSDMTAVTDGELSVRSSHYIFTEPYKLLAHLYMGASGTRANVQIPSFNAVGRFNVWPINLSSANVPSPPRVAWLDARPPDIPQEEEYTVKATSTASENVFYLGWLQSPGHTRNVPAGELIIPVRCTFTPTQVASAWSAQYALTFEQALQGGVYSVVGAELQGAGTIAFRLVFPRARTYHGRRLRPGWLASQSIGDLQEGRVLDNPMLFGEWGRFVAYEPPVIEVFSAGTAAAAHELRLWLVRLGRETSQHLDPWVNQGWQ